MSAFVQVPLHRFFDCRKRPRQTNDDEGDIGNPAPVVSNAVAPVKEVEAEVEAEPILGEHKEKELGPRLEAEAEAEAEADEDEGLPPRKRAPPREDVTSDGSYYTKTRKIKCDREAMVARSFVVPEDVARACLSPAIFTLLHGAVGSTIPDPKKRHQHTAGHQAQEEMRLLLFLGERDGTEFQPYVTKRFAERLEERLRASASCWDDATPMWTDREDFYMDDGSVLQTLLIPTSPFLSTRVARTKCCVAAALDFEQPCEHRPHMVCVQHITQVCGDVTNLDIDSMDTQRVIFRKFMAFRSGAWTYRISKVWEGTSHAEVMTTKCMVDPRWEVHLELNYKRYRGHHVHQMHAAVAAVTDTDQDGGDVGIEEGHMKQLALARTAASMLLKMRDLVNDMPSIEHRTVFADKHAVPLKTVFKPFTKAKAKAEAEAEAKAEAAAEDDASDVRDSVA